MRALAVAAAALALGGCRDPVPLPVGHDLSSPSLYCPPRPPADGAYACDPAAIPFCTFPDLELTCWCAPKPSGGRALYCNDVPDGG
jgi:hypothetical protein